MIHGFGLLICSTASRASASGVMWLTRVATRMLMATVSLALPVGTVHPPTTLARASSGHGGRH